VKNEKYPIEVDMGAAVGAENLQPLQHIAPTAYCLYNMLP